MGCTATTKLQMHCQGHHNTPLYVTYFRDYPVRRSTLLPQYTLKNSAVVSSDYSTQIFLEYSLRQFVLLSLFNLAPHCGYHPCNLERYTRHFLDVYRFTIKVIRDYSPQ